MIKTHKVTGLKYLCQTTRNPYSYKGSGTYWNQHCKKHGYNFTTRVLFKSKNSILFEQIAYEYSKKLDVVKSTDFANLVEEHGGSMGGRANPNYKSGKFVGRLDNSELYKEIDKQRHLERWDDVKKRVHPRMNFFYHKRNGNRERAEYYWNKWYEMAPKKSKNRQALWATDTFEMWYNRKGNDLDFRNLG